MDAEPTVDKVREYLLNEWVDVREGQKKRVSGKKGRCPTPWRGCCASDIHCVRDWKRMASAATWHAPTGFVFLAANLKILVLAGTTSLPTHSSPLVERHLCDGPISPFVRLPSWT